MLLGICRFVFVVALAIRGGSLLCYVDTVEMLAFRDSGNALFSQSEMMSVLDDIFLYSPPTQMLMAQYCWIFWSWMDLLDFS